MEKGEVEKLAQSGVFEDRTLNGELIETHISWIILSGTDVFKLKKPVKLSFLDFSTLALRKKYCLREIKLNSRYSDIYLSVLPIRLVEDGWAIGDSKGEIKDYVVRMKRLPSESRMDYLLEQQKVSESDIRLLALEVAQFHHEAEQITTSFILSKAKNTFNDLQSVQELVKQHLEPDFQRIIPESIKWSDAFLQKYGKRFQERMDEGFFRDIHGDLHSGNVFLHKKPVIFDCIEFNDGFRRIDMLYEVAFMCMDLEGFKAERLSRLFLSEYIRHNKTFQKEEDEAIFVYYKCLRANIRAKVHALAVQEGNNSEENASNLDQLRKYLLLMKAYINQSR
ncbi:phosphotransferase [Pleomorphovibrio marinus]|uniref:phosphotransferase n=1 Tax=Pleomorphovibrio marinus TaxID=2164132 RepID=UPI000E0BFE2C|nr:phosphotransferase [Pleomorphovibrio marinus]